MSRSEVNVAALQDALREVTKKAQERKQRIDELEAVEPLATAFAVLAAKGFTLCEEPSAEERALVNEAYRLLALPPRYPEG